MSVGDFFSLQYLSTFYDIVNGGQGGNEDLEQRVTTLENQVNDINNTNATQGSQITSLSNQVNTLISDFNSLDNLVRNQLEPTVSDLNNTVTGHGLQIQTLQNQVSDIYNVNTTQDSQITSLNNRVTTLENAPIPPVIQPLGVVQVDNMPNFFGVHSWYRLFNFGGLSGNSAADFRVYLLMLRSVHANTTTPSVTLDIPGGGFSAQYGTGKFLYNTIQVLDPVTNQTWQWAIGFNGNFQQVQITGAGPGDSHPDNQSFWFIVMGI
jgi:uncharacterized coiled-coil protein SlyX